MVTTVHGIDHTTLRCRPDELPAMAAFYTDLLGMVEGPRPAFPFPGHWLSLEGWPRIHLAGIAPAGPDGSGRQDRGCVDHIAFRASGLDAMRDRLTQRGVPYAEQPVPGLPLLQLFLADPCGMKIELSFDLLDEAAAHPEPLRFIEANGTRTAFTMAGSGAPLLMLHGGEADHAMFEALGRQLRRHFTVISPDQRDSGATTHSSTSYDLADLAADAAAMLDALGIERCHVYGTSLGGQIAQVLACRHPARIGQLILGSSWRVGRSLVDIAPGTAQELTCLRADALRHAAEIARYFFPPLALQLRPALVSIFSGGTRSADMRARRAALMSSPPCIDLRAVQARTLLLLGNEDRLVPSAASIALADEIEDATIDAMPGVGHVGALQAPIEVAACIRRFLEDES